MNLFIDWVSSTGFFIIFDNKKNIIVETKFKILWNESSKLLPALDDFLKENNYNYFDIENIVVVNWPWSFTWIRSITLLVNTINYIINKDITDITYFDLFRKYPIIKTSSKRDCFIKKSEKLDIEILKNEEIEEYLKNNNIIEVYWDSNINFLAWIKIFDKIDYSSIIKNINFKKQNLIKAFYVKKPNIS